MASSENDGLISVDKFGGENFNLYKFKLEMAMSTKDLWEIVDGSELPPPSTASDEVKKAYERRCKKAFAIIAMSLVLANESKKQRDQRGAKDTIHKDCIQWRERISSPLMPLFICVS